MERNEGCPRVEPITEFENPKAAEPKLMKIMVKTNLPPKCRPPCSEPFSCLVML